MSGFHYSLNTILLHFIVNIVFSNAEYQFNITECQKEDFLSENGTKTGWEVIGPLNETNVQEDLIIKNWFLNFSEGISPKLWLGGGAGWRAPHITNMLNITMKHCPADKDWVYPGFPNTVANIVLLYYGRWKEIRAILTGNEEDLIEEEATEAPAGGNGTDGTTTMMPPGVTSGPDDTTTTKNPGGDGVDDTTTAATARRKKRMAGGRYPDAAEGKRRRRQPTVQTSPATTAAPATTTGAGSTGQPSTGGTGAPGETTTEGPQATSTDLYGEVLPQRRFNYSNDQEKAYWKKMHDSYEKCLEVEPNLNFGSRGSLLTEFERKDQKKDNEENWTPIIITQEMADKIPILDIVIESIWFMYQATAAICFGESGRMNFASNIFHYFIRDFIKPLETLWREPMAYNYGPIFGDMDIYEGLYNLRACTVAIYQSMGMEDILPVRPMIVEPRTNPHVGGHNRRILI